MAVIDRWFSVWSYQSHSGSYLKFIISYALLPVRKYFLLIHFVMAPYTCCTSIRSPHAPNWRRFSLLLFNLWCPFRGSSNAWLLAIIVFNFPPRSLTLLYSFVLSQGLFGINTFSRSFHIKCSIVTKFMPINARRGAQRLREYRQVSIRRFPWGLCPGNCWTLFRNQDYL